MAPLTLQAHVADDGTLTLTLPPAYRAADVDVLIHRRDEPARTWRDMTEAEWREGLRRIAGSVDDDTFAAPDP